MPQLKIDLVVDDKGSLVITGFGSKVDKVMWSSGSAVKSLSKELAIAGAGLAALMYPATKVMSEAIALANVQEKAEAKLNAVLRSTGEAAGFNTAQLKNMAAAFQEVTTTGDETIINGMAVLATFKQIGGEAFERATEAALDLSAVMDQDLQSSMVQIGKALNDPINGLTALQRVGVSFTETQKQLIKSLQESGDIMGAQKIILKELESEFGGAARAAAEKFGGKMLQLQNAFGDFKEEIGFTITKSKEFSVVLDESKETLKDMAVWVEEHREDIAQMFLNTIEAGKKVVPVLGDVGSAVGTLYNAIKQLETIGGPSVGKWGLVGYALLRGGPQAAALVLALETVNKALHEQGNGIQDLPGKYREYRSEVQNLMDVFSGKRDWNTGEWLNGAAEAAQGVAEEIGVQAVIASSTWQDEWKKMEEAAAESASAQAVSQGKALKSMRDQYDKYVGKVLQLQGKIADGERSLAHELRGMARTGMTDLGAWRDLKREADAYFEAARKAMSASDYNTAQEYAKLAKEAYGDLNEEVKDGETVQVSAADALKTAMAGVSNAGQLNLDIMKKQQAEASALANELNKQSGGGFGSVTIDESTAAAVRFQEETKTLTKHWETMWETVGADGKRVLTEIAGEINKLDGSTITIYTKHVEKDSAGGLVGRYALGGQVFSRLASPFITSGGGMVDDVPAMLKRFEYVMRPEAVQHYGVGFMEAVNRRKLPVDGAVHASTGGAVWQLAGAARSFSPQRFAEGGPVKTAVTGGAGGSVVVRFSFPGSPVQPKGVFSKDDVRALLRQMKEMDRARS